MYFDPTQDGGHVYETVLARNVISSAAIWVLIKNSQNKLLWCFFSGAITSFLQLINFFLWHFEIISTLMETLIST